MLAGHSILRSTINSLQQLQDEDWEAFREPWKPVSFKRKQLITQSGGSERYLYFVLEGVQRIYHLDDSGKESTLLFTYAPSFGGVIDALLLQQPSAYFYEALTASEMLRISYHDLHTLMDSRPAIHSFVTTALTISLSGLLKRLVELQSCSSEEKFRRLLKRSPHILQLVPHKYLANYLGIDATNFSKLMNSVRI